MNVTLVRPGPSRPDRTARPEKDRKHHGPPVISTAQAPFDRLVTPKEDIYPLADPEVAARLALSSIAISS